MRPLAAAGLAMPLLPALAANAGAPQSNVDKGNDAGNNNGDDKVNTLNSGQLDENQWPANAQPMVDPASAQPVQPTAPK